MTSHSFILQL